MAAVNPTNFTSLIVDEFIQYATRHLNTITGSVTTLSLYPPIPTPSPGILIWKGYTIPPAGTITSDLRDTIKVNEINKLPPSENYQLETDPEKNAEFQERLGAVSGEEGDGIDYGAKPIAVNNLRTPEIPASTIYTEIGKIITTDKGIFLDLGGTNAFEADGSVIGQTLPLGDAYYFGKLHVLEGGKTVTMPRSGPSFGLTRADELRRIRFDGKTLADVDISLPWELLSEAMMIKKEGFTEVAERIDEDAYRLGYGTRRIWDPVRNGPKLDVNGKIYEARVGDRTTEANALKMLKYEVAITYKDRLVGNASYQIRQADFDKLNNVQRAGLITYVYNAGSISEEIAAAIRAGNYVEAANRMLYGPITGSETGDVYAGLIRRRAEEAVFMIYGYNN